MNNIGEQIIMGCLSALVAALIISLILAGFAQWLWMIIIVPKFGAPVLTFWEMYGLIVLLRILFAFNTTTYHKTS